MAWCWTAADVERHATVRASGEIHQQEGSTKCKTQHTIRTELRATTTRSLLPGFSPGIHARNTLKLTDFCEFIAPCWARKPEQGNRSGQIRGALWTKTQAQSERGAGSPVLKLTSKCGKLLELTSSRSRCPRANRFDVGY